METPKFIRGYLGKGRTFKRSRSLEIISVPDKNPWTEAVDPLSGLPLVELIDSELNVVMVAADFKNSYYGSHKMNLFREDHLSRNINSARCSIADCFVISNCFCHHEAKCIKYTQMNAKKPNNRRTYKQLRCQRALSFGSV